MGGVRRLLGWAFTGGVVCACMLLAAPAGAAPAGGTSSLGSRLQIPPPGEPSPSLGEPLPLTPALVPAAGSADAQVEVISEGLTSCLAVHGEIESSRNGEVSLGATVDGFLVWEGRDPVTFVRLNEEFGTAAGMEIAESAPWDHHRHHRLVSRCAGSEDTGSADMPVTPLPEVVGVVPGRNPVEDASATTPLASAPSPEQGADAAFSVPYNPHSGDTVDKQLSPSDVRVPGGNPDQASAARSSLPDAGPPSLGPLVAALLLMGAALVVPSSILFVLQARKGPQWVRANVRAVAEAAPAVGIELIPRTDDSWLPTSVVRFALRADSGTQILIEVKQ